MDTTGHTARAVNALTRGWAGSLPAGTGTVLTAAGVWPLLAFLAAGADGPVRAELGEALGVPVEDAPGQARELLAGLGALPGVRTATGVWTRAHLRLDPRWAAGLGPGTRGLLPADPAAARAELDAWAERHTDGLIRSMPVVLDRSTLLVLASALVARTRWVHPMRPSFLHADGGPWAGRTLAALRVDHSGLFDRAAVAETAAGPVTEVRLPGSGDLDVHLLLGAAEAPLGAVAAAGIDLLEGRAARVPVSSLRGGGTWPGLDVRKVPGLRPENRLSLTTVPFTVRAEHDLKDRAELFGLTRACAEGGFSKITTDEPLRVASARQAATATFGALGFEAAAVTAFSMSRSGSASRPPTYTTTLAEVLLDRPFAFLAVHRPSGLVLAAGRVTEAGDAA